MARKEVVFPSVALIVSLVVGSIWGAVSLIAIILSGLGDHPVNGASSWYYFFWSAVAPIIFLPGYLILRFDLLSGLVSLFTSALFGFAILFFLILLIHYLKRAVLKKLQESVT